MSDVFFCFGPDKGSYLIDTKKTYKSKGMPEAMIDAKGKNKVQKIYTVAVQQEKGSYLCYLDQNDSIWHWSAYAMKKSCPGLVQWLETRRAKHCSKHLSVTFGPTTTTYAACAPCCKVTWRSNVPDSCETAMKSLSKVRHVALGAGNAYVILYEGGIRWNLDGNYQALNKILENKGGSKVTFVALNPWYVEQFFLILDNDTAYLQVDASLETAVRNVMKNEGMSCHAL